MRNVWRKTVVSVGIAVALMVGPGIGMANAAPLQIQPTQGPIVPPDPLPVGDVMVGFNDLVTTKARSGRRGAWSSETRYELY